MPYVAYAFYINRLRKDTGFEDDLKNHKVVMLVYNSQASDPVAERMEKLAKQSGIPVVGATETEPLGVAYQQWMSSELDAVDHALPK